MKKVKIITFHPGLNYGAVLQAFALLKTIEKLGFNVQVINYRPFKLMKKYYRFFVRPVNFIARLKQHYNFSKFRTKNLAQTKKFRNLGQLNKSKIYADYLICGSDQIWNSLVFGEIDFAYLLSFGKKGQKRISYAASLGANNFPIESVDQIKKELKEFSAISVREKFAQDEIERVLEIKAELVLDPTLLVSDYSGFLTEPKKRPKKYILVYAIEYSGFLRKNVQIAKDVLKLPVVNISSWYFKDADINAIGISPSVWLGWFKNAEYVVTNSFHGTAFSINFQRNFSFISIEQHRGLNNRVIDLLSVLEIQDRTVHLNDEKNIYRNLKGKIDYLEAFKKLEIARIGSIIFLENALDLNNL